MGPKKEKKTEAGSWVDLAHGPLLEINVNDLNGGELGVIPQHMGNLTTVAIERRVELKERGLRGKELPWHPIRQSLHC